MSFSSISIPHRLNDQFNALRCFLISSVILIFCCCEAEKVDTSMLQGNWMVSAASRSGIPTTTLKDAYFTFIGDTVMVTNLLREPKTFRYDYDGNTISQSGEMDVNYEIVKLSTDTLVMKANIQNYDFEFFLLKDKDFELDRIEQPVPR